MLEHTFAPGFRVDLHHKDLSIFTSSAREAGVATPMGAQVAQLMGSLRAQGHGDLDHSALLLLVESLSGRASTGAGTSTSDGAAGQTAPQHGHRRGGVDVLGLEINDGLGEKGQVTGHEELVGRLDRLPGAGRSDVDHGLAHQLEQRPRRFDAPG